MALDDFLEPEVAVAVAVTAVVASPGIRKVLRKGAVYGLAGLLIAKDKLVGFAHNVAENARQTTAAQPATAAAPAPSEGAVPEAAPG